MDISLLRYALEHPSSYSIDEVLLKLVNEKVYIYGAGSFGEEIYRLLKQFHISIMAFLDKNANIINEKMGVKVYQLEDIDTIERKKATVLLSIVMDKDERITLTDRIKNSGYKSVIEAQSLRCFLVDFDRYYGFNIFEYIKSQENNIYTAADLFEDERSKDIYICNVYSHLTRDYSNCKLFESDMKEQYFPSEIHLYKGYSHFIDCGGYIGDTVLQLISRTEVKSIVSFEPNMENFKELSDTCEHICGKRDIQIVLFPCAVSGSMGMTSFTGNGGSGAISTAGDDLIQCVALDKVFKKIPVTFIKMDIEGEELNALHGAKAIIENQKPDLAICVYHCISHLWEIPLYLKKINPAYQIYLRSYNAYTMETVLYATCYTQEKL